MCSPEHIALQRDARAESGAHLKQLLMGNARYVFTLIHEFRTEPGHLYPVLSERSDLRYHHE